MKKLGLVLIILLIASTAHAVIAVDNAEQRIAQIVVQSSRIADSTASQLRVLREEGVDIVADVGGSLDATDKAELATYNGLLTDAQNALDAVKAYKDATWANIK